MHELAPINFDNLLGFCVSSVQIGMLAFKKLVTVDLCLKAYYTSGQFVLPGGSGLEKVNDKLRAAALVKLVKRPKKKAVDLTDQQMLDGFEAMEQDLAKKEGWSCPNPGFTVHFPKKGKYIKSSWPSNGNNKFLDSWIIFVLSAFFEERKHFGVARSLIAVH